ncbi:MAG: 23S rRNA pseudouridine(1911/1915/1917) synthase RluD [Pseudomonadota bacterium]
MAKTQDHLIEITIPDSMYGERVDKALGKLCADLSRGAIQELIRQGKVLVDEEPPKQRDKVQGGEQVEISVEPAQNDVWQPQDIDFKVVFEDDDLIVINKPAGLVVHPGAGNPDGTLLNGILYRSPENHRLVRAGIVHRLDKDTSGLMVVAKTEKTRLALVEDLAEHLVEREYAAICYGRVISGGTIDEPIGRDRHDRRKMCVSQFGKPAITHYRVADRYRYHSLLTVQLETGRTHQIRVHMTHLGFNLIGDPVYGRRLAIPGDCSPALESQLRAFDRQALHAQKLQFTHPTSQESVAFEAELPADMVALIDVLAQDSQL